MFTIRSLKIKIASSDDPVTLFLNETGSIDNIKRNICFYRIIGINVSDDAYIKQIKAIDNAAEKLSSAYTRINGFAPLPPESVQTYIDSCSAWMQAHDYEPADIIKLFLPLDFPNATVEWSAKKAFHRVLKIFMDKHNVTDSVLKNFIVKMLFWMEQYAKPVLKGGFFPKIVVTGEVKKHEGLFLLFCANAGCDVLYIHPCVDFPTVYPELINFSKLHEAGIRRHCTIPVPAYERMIMPSVPKTKSRPKPPQTIHAPISAVQASAGAMLSYEELAALSASVVMISVFDDNKECIGTGSGVVINENGMILTNCHVINGGAYFSVRFENDDDEYLTDSIIKYHTDFDLAIIHVEKSCRPIPLEQNSNLVRGQKIMAIGSPLGLFNTVSDGIISGFRQINDVNVIQFTAPTSGGSSGGALIDMRGRLIGIIQGGFTIGQNLNLAVEHQYIYDFVRSFI